MVDRSDKEMNFDSPKKDLFGNKKVGMPSSKTHIRICNAVVKLTGRKNFLNKNSDEL